MTSSNNKEGFPLQTFEQNEEPIEFSDDEFVAKKSRLTGVQLEKKRQEVLEFLFPDRRADIRTFIEEARQVNQLILTDPGETDGMGKADRISLYGVLRCFDPMTVIETGTASGISSTVILKALQENGKGYLHTVDPLPPEKVGQLMPSGMKKNVTIHHGNSIEIIPTIRGASGPFDFFLHDSSHTYEHMAREFELALRHGTETVCICSHDILKNNAWDHFIQRSEVMVSGAIRNFGIALCRGASRDG